MLVFQYGSNCLDSQINGDSRLRGEASYVGIASVSDFEIAFDVWSKNRACAAADMVSKLGAVVWGVLYQVPDHLMARETAASIGRISFDAIEGEGKNYIRRKVQVRKPGGEVIEAVTYTVAAPQTGLKTSLTYVSLIVKGLRERGIDPEYIGSVKSIASSNNPGIAKEVETL